jgi:phage-related tail protein
MGKIEKAQKELEASLEAARFAAEASLNEKMEKSEEMKNLQMEDMLKKIKEHQEHVKEVRSNQEEMLKPHVKKVQATIKAKEERARFFQHTLLKLIAIHISC